MRFFKSHIFTKIIPIILILIVVLIQIVKIDIINTKALSPLGNTNENYQLVSKELGEDFSNFIKDNSYLKIYKEKNNEVLLRLGNKDFKITNESIFIKKIGSIFNNITEKITQLIGK